MQNIKKTFSYLKKNAVNILANLKNRSQKFKEKFEEAKNQPRLKRKSLFLGFATVLGIFGVTLVTSVLSAVAKDIPKNTPKFAKVCFNPPVNQPRIAPSEEIMKGISNAAVTICSLAVSSVPYALGAACNLIVAVGILKAQKK